jgi:hypothetical protein
MTLPGVGVGNIYTDWLAQVDYTTSDIGGFRLTIGVFDRLEPLGQRALAVPES